MTDSGTHLFNSHNSAPVQHACNLFDFVRVHAFGHLAEGMDPDVLDFANTAAPSYGATVEWALTMPEVQEQLQSQEAAESGAAQAVAPSERAQMTKEQRKQRMQYLQQRISEAADVDVLEHDIGRDVSVANAWLSDAEREILAQAMQRRSAALAPPRGLKLDIVRKWLAPSVALHHAFPNVTAKGTPCCTIANVEALCARLGVAIRYNVISKRQEILGPQISFTGDNYDNASLSWLVSECAAVGIPYQMATLKGYVTVIADRNQYNPVLAWIESKPWDGASRIDALAATFIARSGFDEELKRLMLRKWLVQAVAAAASPVPLQLRGMLVLQGGQYIGKSRWLKSLVPGHEELAVTGRTLVPGQKDSVNTAISHWLVELGELDATFKKADIAALKAFISQDEDTFRLPYAPTDSKFQRRTCFFGSVNDEQFLHDATGNTRFWCIPVERVGHDHGVDMQQLWAEVLALWRGGEQHWLSNDDMQIVSDSSRRFEATDPIKEKIELKFAWEEAATKPGTVEYRVMTATEVLA